MAISFADNVNDFVRILILLNATKENKSLLMTAHKIMLFDYYLKFPNTMGVANDMANDTQTLDEYYAFFHWQPDVIRYRQSLNYLVAKGLVRKHADKKLTYFCITELGQKAITEIRSTYKTRLEMMAAVFVPRIIKLSDTRIEQEIRNKSDILLRNGSVQNEKKTEN